MKKRSLTYFGLLLLGVLIGVQLDAQTNVNHPYNGNQFLTNQVPVGGFYNYYDNNGPNGVYTANSNNTLASMTFTPSDPTRKVIISFASYASENSFDCMYIYNGPTVGVNQILSGSGAPIGGPAPAGFLV